MKNAPPRREPDITSPSLQEAHILQSSESSLSCPSESSLFFLFTFFSTRGTRMSSPSEKSLGSSAISSPRSVERKGKLVQGPGRGGSSALVGGSRYRDAYSSIRRLVTSAFAARPGCTRGMLNTMPPQLLQSSRTCDQLDSHVEM